MALNIKNKNTGDLLTATEFNLVVQAIRDNETDISTLQQKVVKIVALTQDEYDAMAAAGTLEDDTRYQVFEDE